MEERAEGPLTGVVLSIIVPNYNGRALLADCLESIYRNPPTRAFEVFVIDDASADGSYDMVRARFPQVRLMRNQRNLHYGASNNRVFALVRGTYVLLLNNDTEILPDAFDRMIEFLDAHARIGAVGCKLLNGDGSVQASVKVLPSSMAGLFGARSVLTKLFPNNRFTRKHLLHLDGDQTRPFEAGYVSSAAVMIRHSVIQQVGGLDERLSYHVDADYCKRIWDAGWQVFYLPSAVIVHFDHQGGTMVSWKRRFKSVIEFHRGSYIYFQKHQMTSPWHPMHFVTLAGLGLRLVLSLACFAVDELFVRPRTRRPPSTEPGPHGNNGPTAQVPVDQPS